MTRKILKAALYTVAVILAGSLIMLATLWFAANAQTVDSTAVGTGATGKTVSIFILLAIVIEFIARVWPTKFDLSIVSNLLRMLDRVIPNKYLERDTKEGVIRKGIFKVRRKYNETRNV